jgi:hypothetical protein
MEKKFIIWDPKDGLPRYGDWECGDGDKIISDGVLGRITEDNVYLTTYGEYPGEMRPKDLDVNAPIGGVVFRLSGEKGVYDIYRVQ